MPKRLTEREWVTEGERLFGPDRMAWRFECPACGHVQTPADFRPYKDAGATAESALRECIGRWDGHMHVEMGTKPGPCNYAGYGLFQFSPIEVVPNSGDGLPIPAFAFAATVGGHNR